jgi:hypothetical protein
VIDGVPFATAHNQRVWARIGTTTLHRKAVVACASRYLQETQALEETLSISARPNLQAISSGFSIFSLLIGLMGLEPD